MTGAEALRILGLKVGAAKSEIKQAYHDLVKVWHPDRFAHDPRLQKQAEEKLKEINEAHDLLMSANPYGGYRAAGSGPAHPAPPARSSPKKDKDRMMPFVSFLVLLIAIGVVSLVFFIYGREYDPVHTQKSSQELT